MFLSDRHNPWYWNAFQMEVEITLHAAVEGLFKAFLIAVVAVRKTLYCVVNKIIHIVLMTLVL